MQIAYKIEGDSAVIWRCFSYSREIQIPDTIEGYSVTALAPYAFSAHMDLQELRKVHFWGQKQQDEPEVKGEQLQEIRLPDTIKAIGQYCFYNCSHLRKIHFTNQLKDWGSGAFTGCHKISEVDISFLDKEESALREVLLELPEEMEVCCHMLFDEKQSTQTARLMFPEFFEEGVENTPARILETHVHGSGLRYRNCFRQKIFQFAEYDDCFSLAVAQEDPLFVAKLTERRLRWPYGLTKEAKERYALFVKDKKDFFASYVMEKKDIKSLEWFCMFLAGELPEEQCVETVDHMIAMAGKQKYMEGISYLMDFQHTYDIEKNYKGRKSKRKTFDL